MLNDNFYRGSGITLAIQRLLRSKAFEDIDVSLAGAETIGGRKSILEDVSFVASSRYQYFPLMDSGPQLLRTLFRFALWLRKERFDVVHAHHRRMAVLANMLTPISNTPVLFTGHLAFDEAAWFRIAAPPRMTGVSPTVVAYLQRCTKAQTVDLVYNAVLFPEFDPPSSRLMPRTAIAIGRLDPVKGFGTIIEAYAKLRDRGIGGQVEIYGEGSMRDELEGKIRERGLQDRVFLRGFDAGVGERLVEYAFHLLTSEREGFPNAVVEAAAVGVPTLLTGVDGSRDALPPELCLPNALPFGDADALAEALAAWYDAPSLVSEDGQRFYDFLKSRCDPSVVGVAYRRIYESMRAG
jgi:glycosyltransferase involved in cell wall biosynthesis